MLEDSDWNHIITILFGIGGLIFFGMLIGLLKEWGRSDKLYVTIASFILFAVVLVFVGWLAIQVLEGTGVLVEEY